MTKKSFVLHVDSLDVLDELTNEQAGMLLKAMRDYHNEDETPLDALTKIVFCPFKNQFNRDLLNSRSGNFHWNWKGGISSENKILRNSSEYKQWRTNVFNRDEFTCQECGAYGVILNAHHIKPWAKYPEFRFDIDNGLTLCKECHIEVHRER
jgi:predicted restriction endonuclease